MPLHLRTAEHAAVLRPACCGQLSSDASPRRGDYRRDSPADCLVQPNRDARAPPGFKRRAATPLRVPERARAPARLSSGRRTRSRPARHRARARKIQSAVSESRKAPPMRGARKIQSAVSESRRAPPARGAKLMGRVSQRRNPRRARTSRVQAARRHVIPRAGARPRAGAAQNHKRMTCQKKSAQPARRRGSGQDDESDHARRVAARAGGRLATD